MAKKICELCQESYAKDMRLGVKLCLDCTDRFYKAITGDLDTAVSFLDQQSFPNASSAAREYIIGSVARRANRMRAAAQSTHNQVSAPSAETTTPPKKEPISQPLPKGSSQTIDDLYVDIGQKIKGWAKWLFIVEAIASVIGAILMLVNAEDWYILFLGALALVVGPLLAWVSSWILYAFGELVDKISANERNTRNILRILQDGKK